MNFMSQLPGLLSKAVPAAAILNKAKAADPRLKSFVTTALSSGYAANEVLDFMQEKFSGGGQERTEAEIKAKGSQARPDEKAMLALQKGRNLPQQISSAGIGLATGGIAGRMSADAAQTESKPTASGVVSDFASSRLTPERAYKAFVDAGHGDKLDLITARGANMENAFDWATKLIPEDVFGVMSQMFEADPRQIFETAMKYSIGQRGKKRGGKVDLLGVEAPAEEAPQQQAPSGDQELLAAIQNFRNMMGG